MLLLLGLDFQVLNFAFPIFLSTTYLQTHLLQIHYFYRSEKSQEILL